MADTSHNQLLATLKKLLVTGTFSDLTVTCGPDSYKVHKNIVCSRAEFFARAMRFGGKEATEGVVDLPEDDPPTVKLLVQWIYEGDYECDASKTPVVSSPDKTPSTSPTTTNSQFQSRGGRGRGRGGRGGRGGYLPPHLTSHPKISEPVFPHTCNLSWRGCTSRLCAHHTCGDDCDQGVLSECDAFTCDQCTSTPKEVKEQGKELLIHAKMYEIADKYDVTDLKCLVQEKFQSACVSLWDTPGFGIAAHHVFSTTPDHDKGLRDIVASTIMSHTRALVKKPEIEVLLKEFSGLACSLLKAKIDAGWE